MLCSEDVTVYYAHFYAIFQSVPDPRATQGKELVNEIVVRVYKERVRSAYYEYMSDRNLLTLDLKRLSDPFQDSVLQGNSSGEDIV